MNYDNDESFSPSPFSQWHNSPVKRGTVPVASDEELRELAEDIVQFCPSLTALLLAFSPKGTKNPLHGLN